ncbi:MAG TPA: TetR/AcrR family transcriptional regulator [Povalibacter sp.]|uniref:TetR/AcrR family transcriptional regulator n=1 Tax=Povalibacter sp. TaxID=1962978 RepID=UPI002BBBB3CA|nr:TetR/AcrR family transcriptional regulator [Povalibacter sp.]HMN47148.1 TetR/AcrR family transcriptional regulator [Povalibacter sp.]
MTRRPPIALSRKELHRRVWSEPLGTVAREVGLSGSALAKICNRLLVPYPTRGYWVKVAAGQKPPREPLPAAPEKASNDVVFSSVRVSSRRSRTRLDPSARRDQLLKVAEDLIAQQGLHAATMKRIAAIAGISETQSYNYFRSREELFGELARREFARISAAREAELSRTDDHYERITRITRAYLRHIGQRGRLLQILLSSPGVRAMLRAENREKRDTEVQSHASDLMELYGIPRSLALGTTVVLTTLCLRAGKVIADGKISEEAAERLCLTLMLQGSRDLVSRGSTPSRARAAP